MFVSETLVNSAMVNIFNEMLATSRVGGSACTATLQGVADHAHSARRQASHVERPAQTECGSPVVLAHHLLSYLAGGTTC